MEDRSFGKSTYQQQARVASGTVCQAGSASATESFQVTAHAISLPKGGGAIRGINEKFCVNPVTGTGSLTISIHTSLGRAGFWPQLRLSYDSGIENGPRLVAARLCLLPPSRGRLIKTFPRIRMRKTWMSFSSSSPVRRTLFPRKPRMRLESRSLKYPRWNR